MRHVIKYLKETRDVYARLVQGDERYMAAAEGTLIDPPGLTDMRERLAYRREMLEEIDDAVEILEDKT